MGYTDHGPTHVKNSREPCLKNPCAHSWPKGISANASVKNYGLKNDDAEVVVV
jgi:hypothetical protein